MTDRTYTHPDVLGKGIREGWAEDITDPTLIDWEKRQAAALIPFKVVSKRPVNPGEKTLIAHGRNGLGLWGENPMADALVTASTAHPENLAEQRFLLMVKRRDDGTWAAPGGSIEPGEGHIHAGVRELEEETGLRIDPARCRLMRARYVPDSRASGEAWAATRPVRISLGYVDRLPSVKGGDDAKEARWMPAQSYYALEVHVHAAGSRVYPAHVGMLRELLNAGTLADGL